MDAKSISHHLTLVSDSTPLEIPTNVIVSTMVSKWCETDIIPDDLASFDL